MKYKKLWTDMHSNIHHDQIEEHTTDNAEGKLFFSQYSQL